MTIGASTFAKKLSRGARRCRALSGPNRLIFMPLLSLMMAVGLINLIAAREAKGQEVEVRLTQAGIAGDTGNGWRVYPSGTWMAFRIDDGDTEMVYAKGTLKPEDLIHLNDTLNQNNFGELPNKLGGFQSANPETLTIRAGAHVTVLKVPGGTNLLGSSSQKFALDPAGERALTIANTVRALTTQ
jgi:hypothetical protein